MPTGVVLAADADLPAIPEAGLTAPNSFLLSLKGAAEVAAEVKGDGKPSFVSTLAAPGVPCVAARCASAVFAAGAALAASAAVPAGFAPGGSVPASTGRPK